MTALHCILGLLYMTALSVHIGSFIYVSLIIKVPTAVYSLAAGNVSRMVDQVEQFATLFDPDYTPKVHTPRRICVCMHCGVCSCEVMALSYL